ncbi:conserved exported hypothetical protein [Thiomonas arsenitoxydans]|uniref:Uncharacterized protein n=1 Tax=Thiomonas arsenitoxydans (strain DSM 22701 / CIP 110005 / 3As) TaxID=426114 RepID=D6CS94_THIA3|nr:Hypothetical protein; putative exported protein [Thiomonas arsenitoxydans]CQR26956.1 conserved exported hypothetical protein [Thiomonas arsenitoxydans]CQR30197.1 conserved exported hypothetical protein [Thiomonas arsenitoxydans]CQR30256.1 conserved exported hypothetical protein [Thiomonas arsenitoxydans]CQR32363.1 conserved exported hypothetical protein [Thiomonas arsenitoxydans]
MLTARRWLNVSSLLTRHLIRPLRLQVSGGFFLPGMLSVAQASRALSGWALCSNKSFFSYCPDSRGAVCG